MDGGAEYMRSQKIKKSDSELERERERVYI